MAVVVTSFSSAVVTGDFEDIQSEFGVSLVVVSLTVSLMVCGFGIGPLIWAPMVRPSLAQLLAYLTPKLE